MKNRIVTLLIFLFFSCMVSAQTDSEKADPVGKWKFEAPYAPEGYNTGIIEFSVAENKYSASISFEESGYTISGEKTKVEKDTVTFMVVVEGNEVTINLKAEDAKKMTGKAVYFEGEIPLTLTKHVPKN